LQQHSHAQLMLYGSLLLIMFCVAGHGTIANIGNSA
jgi:hypothetical protein